MSSFIRFLSKRLGPQAPRGGGWAWETRENRGTFGKSMGKLSRKWSFLELKFFFSIHAIDSRILLFGPMRWVCSCHAGRTSAPGRIIEFIPTTVGAAWWSWFCFRIIYMYRNPQLLFVSSKIQSGIWPFLVFISLMVVVSTDAHLNLENQ